MARTSIEKLSNNLQKLVKALRAGGGTALALASKLKCSKPTVYARLEALRAEGYTIKESSVRDHARGPEAAHYLLTR